MFLARIPSSIFRKFTASVLSIVLMTPMLFGNIFLSTVHASYGENNPDSFLYYKQKIESALMDFESEFRLKKSISDATITNVKNLVQEASSRLPDSGEAGNVNESLRKSAILYLDLASQNKSSSPHVQNAAGQVSRFVSQAEIGTVEAQITANPTNGNAPLTTSFLATGKDPSGINIPDNNFVWWMKQSGGYKKELGRGPSFTYTFPKEGNYQILLDVSSESRNKKGRPDVNGVSLSQDIEVRPRLGNVILLINGVNVSNLDTLKVSPTLGKIGLLFDATASRAVSNGTITKTKWDFGNGNTLEYDGPPIVERQLFTNAGTYKVVLEITTNQGQTFSKQLQILLRDPAAVIQMEKEVGFIGEDIRMSAKNYLANTTNIEYNWDIQENDTGKKVVNSKVGNTFSYKFSKVGQYIVTLTTRSPNGSTDTDSQVLTIESRPPIVNLDAPRPMSPEKPNTILFDASRSFDPDTKGSAGLSYTWLIDGEAVELSNAEREGAMGTYTFREKGDHTVTLTVGNSYGKITSVDKKFRVESTLTVDMNISPRAAPIGTLLNFQARSPQARFFEWNIGDGSPPINGTTDAIQHTYKKTGIYSARLSVKNSDGSEQNSVTRKVYITDTDSPFALIDIRNSKGTVLEDPTACENQNGAFLINRADNTTLDGNNSINVDGNTSGLTYTWKYLDKVKTGPSFSEKFTDLGCFPIELTVRSERTGKTHTSVRYIQIKNLPPKVTSVDSRIDTAKKDTQKLIVNVTANGARDDDGVITSYIWFYTTESDTEKQNIRITQTPSTTFVLPNITEKYYFSVIVEDNDGARYNSSEFVTEQIPLLVANDDANMNIPLISLSVDKTQLLTDEIARFSASAKNILGTDITMKSEYYWDFDGDNKIDQKTKEPQASYKYKRSGKYNMKVKVINNGVSNTKYQVLYVKNELKAAAVGYRMGDMVYFLNTSKGSYENVKWNIGGIESSAPYGFSAPAYSLSGEVYGTLTVNGVGDETSTFTITPFVIEDLSLDEGGISIQTFPKMESGAITLISPSDKVLISLYGNTGVKEYAIDTDIKIDSDLDAVGDNDVDNKDTASFTDGGIYALDTSIESRMKTRDMKIVFTGDDGKVIGTKVIRLIFDYVPGSVNDGTELTSTGTEGFSQNDKMNLEKLQAKIRTLEPEDRIIFTQYYNNLIENWDDLYDRTEGLLLIQKEVNASITFDENQKAEFSEIIDTILVGDAQAVNDISVASRVIEGLIPKSENKDYIVERLEKIKAQPGNLTQNKLLGKEILETVQNDPAISTENKLLIRTQLLTIVNGGQQNVSSEAQEKIATESSSGGSGFLSFISGTVKIFLIIIGVILGLFLLGFIFYRLTRKNEDIGFQDFLIDSIAHSKGRPPKTVANTPTENSAIIIPKKDEALITPVEVPPQRTGISADPLESIGVYKGTSSDPSPLDTPSPVSENGGDSSSPSVEDTTTEAAVHTIPDWLKPVTTESTEKKNEDGTEPWIKDDSDALIVKEGADMIVKPVEEKSSDTPPEETREDLGTTTNLPSSDPLLDPLSVEEPGETSEIQDPLLVGEDATISSGSSNLSGTGGEETPERDATQNIVLPNAETEITTTSEEDIIPDWLKIEGTNPEEEKGSNELSTPEAGVETSTSITPEDGAELPEWLKNSIDTETPPSSPEKKPKQKEKKERPPKKGLTAKTLKSEAESPEKKPKTHIEDIPDWLK